VENYDASLDIYPRGIELMLSRLVSRVVRHEGRKFLQLNPINAEFKHSHELATNRDKASLYVHIPFCRRLCPYCSFNRFPYAEDKAKIYYKNLKNEIEHYIRLGFTFDRVYFGGGTPTVDMKELLSFLDFLDESFNIKQISLEANPTDIDPENLEELVERKVKRLSIGIQSFDDKILKSIGRPYLSGHEIKEKLSNATGIFDTLNIDLIWNLPTQSLTQFRRDIATFRALGIDQATFYPLMPSLRRRTALERKFTKINESREKRFYRAILDDVFHNGYSASTPWCFSKGDKIIDEYIVDYDDFIGTGSGAVSYLNGIFYINSFSLERYGKLTQSDRLPVVLWKKLSFRETAQYYFLTKMFGMSLNRLEFLRRFKKDVYRLLIPEIFTGLGTGMLQEREGLIHVTERGMFYVSTLMKEFFAALNNLREYCMIHKL
jgi:coproporphyrinogen III oxidase-like Fe-S oxidoreductase